MEITNFDSNDLAAFIVNRELYAEKEYFFESKDILNIIYISQVQDFCKICDNQKPFINKNSKTENNRHYQGWPTVTIIEYEQSKFKFIQFQCVTCEEETRNYMLLQSINDNKISFLKFGEFPRNDLKQNKQLSKFYKKDQDLYRKASTCLAHGFGVGAFAYMRRIVENNILNLLELIADGYDADESVITALNELKKESPMSDKIEIANNALPSSLKPSGINPLKTIYKVLSEGVHKLSDEECLNKAKQIDQCMLFITSELANHKKNVEMLKGNLSKLNS
ncbi:hypothetical protein [Acinetobacter entericus]|uniref:Short-chain dehydrogenase n=1 Tax=Acinetobacter entericus TaxID=2989714 RepID=A0ABT3NEG0_9GAMM|nr:hypothetical protein [Acinetobacter entericus]MCW8037939.1 hypothetical protein [Acinetobacter entericus]